MRPYVHRTNLAFGTLAMRRTLPACLLLLLGLSGCAFDVSVLRTIPASFAPGGECGRPWVLTQDTTVGLGTGFPTRLRRDTRWRCIGTVEAGQVYQTTDQIVTVEASNIHEARVVLRGHELVGFYLPVERRLAPVEPALPLSIQETTP